MTLYELRVEHRAQPIGFDEKAPRFSWKITSEKENVLQSAYRIMVSHNGIVDWDSGEIQDGQSILVEYAGADLLPCTIYDAQVEVWDNHGEYALERT
ncbi:MAG: hypothetical protein LBF78_07775, partial [Treponema sp.]|nr:hypothetical protein [Treponema sp.]